MLTNFSLDQNYPNPFNPTTITVNVLKEKSQERLSLLNSIGEKIAILVNEEKDRGYHKVNLNANRLPSGV